MTHAHTRERHENKNTRFWATYDETSLYATKFINISFRTPYSMHDDWSIAINERSICGLCISKISHMRSSNLVYIYFITILYSCLRFQRFVIQFSITVTTSAAISRTTFNDNCYDLLSVMVQSIKTK